LYGKLSLNFSENKILFFSHCSFVCPIDL
jgi:hypothetical protein